MCSSTVSMWGRSIYSAVCDIHPHWACWCTWERRRGGYGWRTWVAVTRLIAYCRGPFSTGQLQARQRVIMITFHFNLLRYSAGSLSIKAVHCTLQHWYTKEQTASNHLMSSFKHYIYVPNASSRVFPACRSSPTLFILSSLRWHLTWTTTLLPACTNLCRTRWRRSHLSLE